MPEFEQNLQTVFDKGNHLLAVLAERWQKHTNRRTVIILLLVGALSTGLYVYAVQPPDSFPLGTLVSVPEGESLKDIAGTLQENGVIRSALMFRTLAILMGDERTMH